jgi:uncharacterized protein YecA (UPF0149 family)
MGLADIQEKQSEERKREKRLVHFTNAVTREFLTSKSIKLKAKTYKNTADYVAKSFLDYLFFKEHKEMREITESHVDHFMLDHAPRKLSFTNESAKTVPEILNKFLTFLETAGHIHNGIELGSRTKKNSRSFAKLIPKTKKTAKRSIKKTTSKKPVAKKTVSKKVLPDVKIGRNDPCPCGSGKKYKKCCGKLS